MGPYFKKDLLQLSDDRVALALMLLMPLVLIAILGFSLQHSFQSVPDDIRIAVVDRDSQEAALTKLEERLSEEMPKEKVEELLAVAPDISAPDLLIEHVLQDDSLQDSIEIEFVSDVEAARDNDAYAAVIEIPSGYRLYMWEHMFLGTSDHSVSLSLFTNSEEAVRSTIVESLVDHFFYEMRLQTVLNRADAANLRQALTPESHIVPRGGEPVTSFQYYTAGMSVMFVLFTAGIVANYAFTEKKTHVFARMLLANTSRWKYLTSRGLTTVWIVFLQLLLLFVVTSLVFNIEWGNLAAVLLLSIALSVAVGGIGTLLTSVNFMLNSSTVSNVFQIFFTSIMAFVGGSMVPVRELSPLLGEIGHFTPNGKALSGYVQIFRGDSLAEITDSLAFLCCFGFACFLIAAILFPRKGALS